MASTSEVAAADAPLERQVLLLEERDPCGDLVIVDNPAGVSLEMDAAQFDAYGLGQE